jgi:hypothetical protein
MSEATATGFVLVDRWRVTHEHEQAFLERYREHVLPIVRGLSGCRTSMVLGAPGPAGESPTPWQLEVLYEFESDDILDRFHSEFAERYEAAFAPRTVADLLAEFAPWVTGHDDSTMTRLPW